MAPQIQTAVPTALDWHVHGEAQWHAGPHTQEVARLSLVMLFTVAFESELLAVTFIGYPRELMIGRAERLYPRQGSQDLNETAILDERLLA